jgi:transglutaminase-like putative cysteine protease
MAPTSNSAWDVVATFPDVPSAHVLVVLLRAEGVPAELVSDTSLLGEARRCEIRVPSELARRARWPMVGINQHPDIWTRRRHGRSSETSGCTT